MSQSSQLSHSFRTASDKEAPRAKHNSRDYQTDSQLEDAEKIGMGLQKLGFKFDYSDFGMFFKHRTSNSRSSNDSYTGRMHLKKKSNETSSSSREGTLKRLSSKDFSNFEDLYENTTIITTPQETKPHSKRVSNEIPMPWKEYLPDIHNHQKKAKLRGMSLSGASIASKDDRQDQQIMGTISKLGLSGESEEQKSDVSFGKDRKLPKNNFNLEVIERIKAKALHYRHSSLSKNPNDQIESYGSGFFTEYKKSSNIPNKNRNEALDFDLTESFQSSDSLLFKPFESELSVLTSQRLTKESGLEKNASAKAFEIQELLKDLEGSFKKEPNLSTIPTESTVDGDFLNTPNLNHHNNSFSTLLSGTNNSFTNSGKLDFNSPLRIDPEKNFHAATVKNSQSISKISIQNNLFNAGPKTQNGGLYEESGSNTDRSNSLSWNEEQTGSVIGTPQGIQKHSFINLSSNTPPPLNRTCQTTKNKPDNSPVSAQNLNKSINQSNPNKSNKSQSKKSDQDQKGNQFFSVDTNKIEMDPRTTLMVKNIPNKYDLPLLLETIERNHKGKYDFLYLPIDPRNRCNVGYAFINFLETKYIRAFYNEFNGKKWEKFNSEKICDIKYGRIQGKKALVHHFQYSNVMSQQDQRLKPHIPSEFESLNNKKLKDLVNKQKLQTGSNF